MPLSEIAVAGSLLARNLIDCKTALFAIFISRFFRVFVESLRLSYPIYISFFGFKIGTKLALVHITCMCLSISIAILLVSIL